MSKVPGQYAVTNQQALDPLARCRGLAVRMDDAVCLRWSRSSRGQCSLPLAEKGVSLPGVKITQHAVLCEVDAVLGTVVVVRLEQLGVCG